jgi:putative endonuclease
MVTRKFTPTEEWEDQRQLLGLKGEKEAMAFLISCGYEIEAHRHRMRRHDIDLIARRGDVVAFVEVKTRRGHAFGTPLEAVGKRKQQSIAKVADLWRIRFGRPKDVYRFDLIAVDEGRDGRFVIQHIEDAWRRDGPAGRPRRDRQRFSGLDRQDEESLDSEDVR